MQELIIATILPAFTILTVFLFNIGTKEVVDRKYGLNTHYFNPIAIISSIQYFIFSFFGIILVKRANDEIYEEPKHMLFLVMIIVLFVIYYISYYKFNKKRDSVFIKSEPYRPNEKKYILYVRIAMLLICLSSFLTTILLYKEIKSAINMLTVKSIDIDSFFLISLIVALFVCYSFIMITAGYIKNYGQLFNFKKYRLIFTEEFREILNTLNSNINYKIKGNILNVYVLVDSDESMMIKIDKIEQCPITIKKEHILNLVPIHEEKASSDVDHIRWYHIGKKPFRVGLSIGSIYYLAIPRIAKIKQDFIKFKRNYTMNELDISPNIEIPIPLLISVFIGILLTIIMEGSKNKKIRDIAIKFIRKNMFNVIFFILGIIPGIILGAGIKFFPGITLGLIAGIIIGKHLIRVMKKK